MRRNKLPNSLRIAIVILVAAMIVAAVLTQIHAAKDRTDLSTLVPDAQLPWNESKEMVEQSLNKIYGTETTSLTLKESKLEGVYEVLFIKDGSKVKSSMVFNFVDGKLRSYTRQFKPDILKDILASAKLNYKGGGDGFVKTSTREIYVYEKVIDKGRIELYMIYDKPSKLIRIQSRFIKQ